MDTFRELVAVAAAEMRSSRRLVRTWLFIVLSVLIGLAFYFYYAVIHGIFSNQSATIGLVHARFLMSGIGIFVIGVFMIAIVFLAFDVRARDAQARMAEVLDSRPTSNVMLMGGRLLGIVLIAWLPLAFLMALIQGFGSAALLFDWPFGEPVQPTSMMAFLIVDAPITFALWCAIVIFLATGLRNRLVVAIGALALFGLFAWGIFQIPIYLLPIVTGSTAMSYTASDLLPGFIDPTIFAQRICALLVTVGLLLFAAVLHPRPDIGSSARRLGAATVLVGLGAAGIVALVLQAAAGAAQQTEWLAAHEARQDDPRVLVDRIAGRVAIEPGEVLRLELDYALTTPAMQSLDELVFSFNPGMTVDELRIGGQEQSFTHEAGLLIVPMRLAAGASADLSIVASGIPDAAFGYLDSVLNPAMLSGAEANLFLLGSQASIYVEDYVALMPAVHWLPTPGTAAGRDDPARYGRDYFAVDLQVDVPAHWLVAGPGRRQGESGRFRFRPAAPLHEVALLASEFERRAFEAAGVEVELLLNAKHLRNVAIYADAAENIRERALGLLEEAEKLGLNYPYDALSLVETPALLRSYGGSWHMASVQSVPGIMLLREYGFPTARFEIRFDDSEEFEQVEGGIAAVKVRVLEDFFQNDVGGGNPLHGALRNVFEFQTGARGEGAIALDFLAHELAVQLITGRRSGYFAAHSYADSEEFQTLVAQSMLSAATGQTVSIGGSVYTAATNRPQVWDRALGAALVDLAPNANPVVALNVLWLKVPNIAEAIIHALGREPTAAFLAELRRRHVGGNFTRTDFAAAAAHVGVDLNAVVGDWLHDAALPGFLTSDVAIFRIADDDQGQPRYQISVHVRNDEPTPGLLRLSYRESVGDESITDATPPIPMAGESATELGLIARNPPTQVWVWPYLSLNRRRLDLTLPEVDKTATVDAEPFSGVRVSDWRPPADAGIVVDDLDPGFTIRQTGAGGTEDVDDDTDWFATTVDLDQGLPVFPFAGVGEWARQELPGGWGKYRHTIARSSPGDGDAEAVFTASLPVAGRWRLDFHMPELRSGGGSIGAARAGGVFIDVSSGSANRRLGSYEVQLLVDGEATPVEFDGSASEVGWNRLGEFQLPAGEVSLTVSNRSSGALVVVDAVRWRQAAGS